jgi:uncharacterized protein YdhG (YjbR/CyaY superfamily)
MIEVSQEVEAYIAALPENRQAPVRTLRALLREQLPTELEETIAYGMISYVVPLRVFPAGYHAQPGQPLPFVSLAAQKHHIALYHMGLYVDPEAVEWFRSAYVKATDAKLDMGKSCIRFKPSADLPLDLIAELCRRIPLDAYIRQYARR